MLVHRAPGARNHRQRRLSRFTGGCANGSAGLAQRLPRLTRHQTDPINRLLSEHVEHTLGRRLRLSAYVLGNGERQGDRGTG